MKEHDFLNVLPTSRNDINYFKCKLSLKWKRKTTVVSWMSNNGHSLSKAAVEIRIN
jgi:hypothetical protein